MPQPKSKTASTPSPTRKAGRPTRSFTPVSDALNQPFTFVDTELAEGIQRHSLVGLLRGAMSRKRRADGEPLTNLFCALLVWPLLKVPSLHCFCAELCQILQGKVSVLYDFLGREDINWRGLSSELARRVTDLTLSDAPILEIYALRWSIEVYFKEIKQHLGFLKEQSGRYQLAYASVHLAAMRYLSSQPAGQRVMASVTQFLKETLRLTVNPKKSAVDRPWKRKFLGFTLSVQRVSRVRVAPQSVERFKDKLRAKFSAGRGRNLKRFLMEDLQPLLRGWASYFSVAETRRVFEDLDEWVRRKLRCMEWRKWKRGRTRYRKLLALGFTKEKARVCAFNGLGPWWNAGSQHLNAALPTSYFRRLGLVLLIEEVDWLTVLHAARSL